MRESCTPGSVRGAPGNGRPYRDPVMNVRLQMLRNGGALRALPAAWQEGVLLTESYSTKRGTGRRLVLSLPRSTPGMGVIGALYDVRLLEADHLGFVFRGLEHIDAASGAKAAVLQEWRVEIRPDAGFMAAPPLAPERRLSETAG